MSGAWAILQHRSSLRRAAALGLSLGTLALAGCGGGDQKSSAEAQPAARPSLTVTAAPATTQLLPRTIQAPGTVAAWQEVPVGAEAGGLTAIRVLADEGSYVRQGQVLVKMNDALIRAQLRQQDAQLASAQAGLAQAQADYQRAANLSGQGYLSQASLDQRLAAQRTWTANVASAQAGRQETMTRLAQTEVRAPVSGLITRRSVVLGQIVAPGTELFRLVRQGQLELNAQVPETELQALRPGLPARVTISEVGEMVGTIRVVTPQVDPQTRIGIARIALPTRPGLRTGMFGTAAISVTAAPTIVVPQAAVVFRDNVSGVFVLDQGNRARFRRIATGERLDRQVAVLSGLNERERVVVNGAGFLGEGDLVTVTTARPAAAVAAAPAAASGAAGR